MSKETVQYHWERHQQCNVDSLNDLIKGTSFAGMELKDIMLGSYNEGNPLPFFSDAAQVCLKSSINNN
jgi:superoxide dismutase, Fe-Mn family